MPALVTTERTVTFEQLRSSVAGIADTLRTYGRERLRVEVDERDQAPACVALLGALEAGCAVMLTRAEVPSQAHPWMGEPVDPETLLQDRPGELGLSPDSDRARLITLTSGTTGQSRAVSLPYRNFAERNRIVQRALSFGTGDVVLALVSLVTSFGQGFYLSALLSGATLVMPPRDQSEIARMALEHSPNVLTGTPVMWWSLIERSFTGAIPPPRFLGLGGEPTPPGLAERVAQVFGDYPKILYGSTEAGLMLTGEYASGRARFRPIEGVRVRTRLDESTGSRTMEVSGPLAEAYVDERGTEAEQIGTWWNSREVVEPEPDGTLDLLGRADHLVKRGSKWLSPVEIEQGLSTLPGVDRICVVPVEDAAVGTLLVAAVVLDDRVTTPNKVMAEARRRGGILPDLVYATGTLPSRNGKVDRTGVARMASAWRKEAQR